MAKVTGGRGGDFLFEIPGIDDGDSGDDTGSSISDWALDYDPETREVTKVTRVSTGEEILFRHDDESMYLSEVVDGVASQTYKLIYDEDGSLVYVNSIGA